MHLDIRTTALTGVAAGGLKFSQWRLHVVAGFIDFMATLAAGGAAEMIYADFTGQFPDTNRALGFASAIGVLLLIFLSNSGMYAVEVLTSRRRQITRVLLLWTSTLAVFGAVAFALKIMPLFPRGFVALFYVAGAALLVGGRLVLAHYVSSAFATSKVSGAQVALIDFCGAARGEAMHELTCHGLDVAMNFQVAPDTEKADLPSLAARVIREVRGSRVEQILITVDCETLRLVRPMLAELQAAPLPVRLVLNERTTELFTWRPERIGSLSSFEIQRPPLSMTEQAVKRLVDICIAGAALVFLLPLMLVIALMIRMDTPGPVFFRQARNGFNGRTFRIFKFRSMSVMEDGAEVKQAVRDDPRVTRVGRFLRRSSLDELPQLLNVLAGEMSISGPRPHAISHDDFYGNLVANYAHRHKLKPGITGWAQAHGYRGETLTVEDMERRVAHDLYYIEHWSLRLDVLILVRTITGVLRARNAF